jgi:hypothetical protein
MPKRTTNKLTYGGGDDVDYKLTFKHPKIKELPSDVKRHVQEAIDRFGSLLVENINKMNEYEDAGNTVLSGIKTTVEKLREANRIEDRLDDPIESAARQ